MAEYKLTISNPKTGKSYSRKLEADVFEGMKLNDIVSGDALGMAGYELKITGGSDKSGFPMRSDLQGPGRRKILTINSKGVHIKNKGIRKRKSVAGNQIGNSIVQVNLSITKPGDTAIEDIFGTKKEEQKEAAA